MSFDNEFDFELLEHHQKEGMQIKAFKHRMENYECDLENTRKCKCGGSVLGRLGTIERNYEDAHNRLIEDYSVNDSKYKKEQFRCRFRMNKQLFLRIMDKVVEHNQYFK